MAEDNRLDHPGDRVLNNQQKDSETFVEQLQHSLIKPNYSLEDQDISFHSVTVTSGTDSEFIIHK